MNTGNMTMRAFGVALPNWPLPLTTWLERARVRTELRRLLELSPHLLADIGMDASQADDEARKHFWQV